MAPKCKEGMYQLGNAGHALDVQFMAAPTPAVDVCPGDFLLSELGTTGVTETKLVSQGTWTTNLATTLTNLCPLFRGIAQQEYGTEECITQPTCLPFIRALKGNGWRRSYRIVDAAGADAPTTWQIGQGFTFGKDPTGNKLSDNTITKTSTSGHIVFRAVSDSGPDSVARAMVEFA